MRCICLFTSGWAHNWGGGAYKLEGQYYHSLGYIPLSLNINIKILHVVNSIHFLGMLFVRFWCQINTFSLCLMIIFLIILVSAVYMYVFTAYVQDASIGVPTLSENNLHATQYKVFPSEVYLKLIRACVIICQFRKMCSQVKAVFILVSFRVSFVS